MNRSASGSFSQEGQFIQSFINFIPALILIDNTNKYCFFNNFLVNNSVCNFSLRNLSSYLIAPNVCFLKGLPVWPALMFP